MQDTALIEIAEALDARDAASARSRILAASPFGLPAVELRLLKTLVRRGLAEFGGGNGSDRALSQRALGFLADCEASLAAHDPWRIFALLEAHAGRVDDQWLGWLLALSVSEHLATVPQEVLGECLVRVFLVGRPHLLESAWTRILIEAPTFVPDFWHYQTLCRTLAEAGWSDPGARVRDLLASTAADRLAPLVSVYDDLLRQSEVGQAMERAAALDDPVHRQRIAQWTLGASQACPCLAQAVALHLEVSGPDDVKDRQFMQARLATSQGRWSDVLHLTEDLVESGDLRHPALCMRALALAHDGRHEEARGALDHVKLGKHAPWFLVGRAMLVDLTNRLLQDGEPLPERLPAPRFARSPGRPLAQSLWIGPRLRWIERLSMQSYLANGWRYQLYVYEEPANVPDGVELMDAAAIQPRAALFREGATSGMHRGSVGAFSDLFRYSLLSQRGGLWTDTDVINLDRFEPDGHRFVATEVSDAGIIGPNGAMMAAPAGCALQSDALRRAQHLLEARSAQFARIGPFLLAEMLARDGLRGYRLMPTEFLNPVGWMETGMLLEPFDTFVARPKLETAHNIHVYTETWRLVGLDLGEAPEGNSFLARLCHMLEDPPTARRNMRELLRG